MLILLGLVLSLAIPTFATNAPATQPSAQEQQMQRWWDDLQKPEPVASRALLNFSANPVPAVAFLQQRLKPLTISNEDLDKLLAELGSDDESIWKPAFEKLEYFDPRLTRDLGTLMTNVAEQVPRDRLVAILCDRPAEFYAGQTVELRSEGDGEYNFVTNNLSWWAEGKVVELGSRPQTEKKKWTRALRAIALLESIGTPEAIAILRDMATGHPDAQPTKAAQEALEKIESAEK